MTIKLFLRISRLQRGYSNHNSRVTFSDDFEAEMAKENHNLYVTFEMKVSFFGAIANSTVIRKSIADVFFRDVGAQGDSDILAETITITPNLTTIIGMPDSD